VIWCDNAFMGSVMEGLWTKHRPPVDGLPGGSTWSLLDLSGLTAAALDQMAPIHEAGHAVIGLRHRQELAEVVINDNAYPGHSGYALWQSGMVDGHDYGVMTAAGERASLRWLRENNLYTQASGWAAEVLSLPDRRTLTARLEEAGCTITFGRPGADFDWATFGREADEDLARCWQQVTAVADRLQERGQLTGHEVAEIMTAAGADSSGVRGEEHAG
jgi:hypothetical protein